MGCHSSFSPRCFCFSDCIVCFLVTQREIGGKRVADGKEESEEDGRRKRGFQLFCLSFKNQQKILNLTNVCLPGRGEGRRQQLLSSETSEPETEVSSLVFHRRRSHPLQTLSSRFRDDVVVVVVVVFFFAKGPRTPQRRINTIHVFFLFSI